MNSANEMFIYDTSVLLGHGAKAFDSVKKGSIVIPLLVLTELNDRMSDSRFGVNAASVVHLIEALVTEQTAKGGRDLELRDGVTLTVEVNHVHTKGVPEIISQSGSEHQRRVLTVAYNLATERAGQQFVYTTLYTKDSLMSVLAAGANSLKVVNPFAGHRRGGKTETTGVIYDQLEDFELASLYANGTIRLPQRFAGDHHECANLAFVQDGTAYSVDPNGDLYQTNYRRFGQESINHRSPEQAIALNHLTSDHISCVAMGGPAGTGKSLLALAVGWGLMSVPGSNIDRMVVFRDLHAVGGQDLGLLPGTMSEKMAPWTAAVMDSMVQIAPQNKIADRLRNGTLDISPLTHIRGRTFTNTFVVVDEAQNLEYDVLLSTLSRLGRNSRVALTYDLSQRDNRFVGRYDGIYDVVQRMKSSKLFAHVNLVKQERSAFAAEVTARLA